jgi:hypothetical protein
MSKDNVACLFKDIKDRDPVFSGRFHANIRTMILG